MAQQFLDKLEDFMPVLLSALLIYAGGVIIIKIIVKVMSAALSKSKADETANTFLVSLVRTLMYILVIIVALSKLNVPMTSIIAALSAAGLAIGLALQNSLSNVAGGFIIMFTHPFRCGDFVEINGVTGKVNAITILYTRLLTADNKAVMIPNGAVSNATIINYTQEDYRRLDMCFSIGYSDDYYKAVELINEVIDSHELALKEPEPPLVVMSEHSASSIKILTRVWVSSAGYWTLNWDMLRLVKESFDKNGIKIPYDQLDINIKK